MFISNPKLTNYDYTIIGSGPAGISLALRLEKNNPSSRILIVESGALQPNRNIQSLSSLKATGDLRSQYFSNHAQRVFGGTSTVWSGWCAVLEKRAFMRGEWPIAYDDIYPYYEPAADILEVPEFAYKTSYIQLSESIIYKPFLISPGSMGTPPVRFNEKYKDYLQQSENIDVLLTTNCKKILTDGKQATAIVLSDSLKKSEAYQLPVKQLILACGGTGNPKLLLQSRIGNPSAVGGYYAGHPHLHRFSSVSIDKNVVDKHFNIGYGISALQLSDAFSIKNNLLNYSVALRFGQPNEQLLLGKKTACYPAKVTLRTEMPCLKENRISLDENKSQMKANFHFNMDDSINNFWGVFSKELLSARLGRAQSSQGKVEINNGGGHHIGTTRMGENPETSVVDKNCQIFNVNNLHVAGSSIFPAAGVSNPTFSIVAFSLRLADHLSKQS